ncbi:MAG: hypothetical protein QXX65_04430 [Candidatus Woesearchaeota archaeon]
MSSLINAYPLCSKVLQERVYRIAENARLPKDLTADLIKAGRLFLSSSAEHKPRISANDLVDLLEMLYAKTGTQFVPIIKRLTYGALSVPEERLREWYATARQIANFYTSITPEEKEKIGETLATSESPDSLRTKVESLHQEEIRQLLANQPWKSAGRNGRTGEHAYRTRSTWNTGKEKQT